MAYTKVLVELVDSRGNVIVAVDSGARFGGTLRRMPETDVRVGDTLDVMLVFGDEPCLLSVAALEHCTSASGRAFRADVRHMDVGGIHLAPPVTTTGAPVVATAPVTAPVEVPAEVTLPVARAVDSVSGVQVHVTVPGLRGRLTDVPFAEVVQLLCAARRTATVEVTRGYDVVGTLGFVEGRAVWATGCGRAGTDAFYALAAIDEGEFAVHYGKAPPTENLHGDTLFLLLEAARRADEARRDSLVPHTAQSAVARIEDVASVVAAAVDAAIAGGPKPPAHPRRRKTDRHPDASSPERRAKNTGMFSGFFEEFSSARERQREASRPVARTRVAATPSDDLVRSPPFASLSFQSHVGEHSAGDRDTDIMKEQLISAS